MRLAAILTAVVALSGCAAAVHPPPRYVYDRYLTDPEMVGGHLVYSDCTRWSDGELTCVAHCPGC